MMDGVELASILWNGLVNRLSKPGLHRYGPEGHVRKEQRLEAETGVRPTFFEVYLKARKGTDPDRPEQLIDEGAMEKMAKYAEYFKRSHGDDVDFLKEPLDVAVAYDAGGGLPHGRIGLGDGYVDREAYSRRRSSSASSSRSQSTAETNELKEQLRRTQEQMQQMQQQMQYLMMAQFLAGVAPDLSSVCRSNHKVPRVAKHIFHHLRDSWRCWAHLGLEAKLLQVFSHKCRRSVRGGRLRQHHFLHQQRVPVKERLMATYFSI